MAKKTDEQKSKKAEEKAAKKAAKKADEKPDKKADKKSAKKAGKKPDKKADKKSAKKVAPIPKGYPVVSTTLNQTDAKATIGFIKSVFGGKVRMKMDGPGGKIMHSEVELGDSLLMVSDAVMEPARVASLFVYTDDVDKTVAKAVKAGATVLMPPADQFWGDRSARIADPFGNLWSIATHVEEVDEDEMKKRSKAFAKQMAGSAG